MNFDFFYGNEAEQFSFFRIPKNLMTGKEYASISVEAKVLYGILLDRMDMVTKNNWFDAENKAFIIYHPSQISQDLNISKGKARDYLKELESVGLIQRRTRGAGLPSIIYLSRFMNMQTA